jgi:LacI family transcriptional regulator
VTTLRDVASAAAVSVATAARVLREDPTLTVRPETRARVVQVAADLGYRPNRLASGLRTRRTGAIALVLPDPQNLAWSEMLRGVERAAAEREYVVVLADAHGPTLAPAQHSRFVLEGRMDGLLVAFAKVEDALVDQIAGRGLPLLPINSRSDAVPGSVTMDDATAARQAVHHLAHLGHRRIAFLAGRSDTDVGRRREAGYRTAMEVHRLPVDGSLLLPGDYTEAMARRVAEPVLAAPPGVRPTAIFTVNLRSALGVRAAAAACGVRIPEDLSLVTLDDHPILEHSDPAMTAVRLPMDEMGELGARLLLDMVEGAPPRHVVTSRPPVLVARASSGPPPAGS